MKIIIHVVLTGGILKNIVLAINFRVEAATGGNAGEDVDLSPEEVWSTNSPCFPEKEEHNMIK